MFWVIKLFCGKFGKLHFRATKNKNLLGRMPSNPTSGFCLQHSIHFLFCAYSMKNACYALKRTQKWHDLVSLGHSSLIACLRCLTFSEGSINLFLRGLFNICDEGWKNVFLFFLKEKSSYFWRGHQHFEHVSTLIFFIRGKFWLMAGWGWM